MQGAAKTIQKFLKKQKGEYLITENFKLNGEHTYQVDDLKIDVEDGEILFYDRDDIVQQNDKGVIKHFLEDSVVEIVVMKNIITIRFSIDEYVTIEL